MFGGHIWKRAANSTLMRRFTPIGCDVEIQDHRQTVLGDEYVSRFEILVKNTAGVSVSKAGRKLTDHPSATSFGIVEMVEFMTWNYSFREVREELLQSQAGFASRP